jgi:hypothetical protein
MHAFDNEYNGSTIELKFSWTLVLAVSPTPTVRVSQKCLCLLEMGYRISSSAVQPVPVC